MSGWPREPSPDYECPVEAFSVDMLPLGSHRMSTAHIKLDMLHRGVTHVQMSVRYMYEENTVHWANMPMRDTRDAVATCFLWAAHWGATMYAFRPLWEHNYDSDPTVDDKCHSGVTLNCVVCLRQWNKFRVGHPQGVTQERHVREAHMKVDKPAGEPWSGSLEKCSI